MKHFILTWGIIILSAACDTFAAFVVKKKFNELGEIDYSSFGAVMDYALLMIKSPLLILGIITFAAAPALWFIALNRIDLSVGYPVLVGFHLLFVMIAGIFYLNEDFTTVKLIGTILIVISVFLFSYEKKGKDEASKRVEAEKVEENAS